MPEMTKTMAEAVKNLPKFDAEYLATSKYYKGGFDQKVVSMHAQKL
jgi:DnaJ homolog subfamily C member 19